MTLYWQEESWDYNCCEDLAYLKGTLGKTLGIRDYGQKRPEKSFRSNIEDLGQVLGRLILYVFFMSSVQGYTIFNLHTALGNI